MQSPKNYFCKKCKQFISNFELELKKNHQNFVIKIPSELLNMYTLSETIGMGNFSIVFKCIEKEEKNVYAIKLIHFEDSDLSELEIQENFKDLMKEIKIYSNIKHENIIRYLTSYLFYDEKMVAVIMELAETSISNVLSNITNEQALSFLIQTAHAVNYTHNMKNLIHRNLKPQNLLILKGKIKISDFGVTEMKFTNKLTYSNIVGTPEYMAPEILNEEKMIDHKTDIWAFGIIIHQILTGGIHPFGKSTSNMRRGLYIIDKDITDEKYIQILSGCFELEPSKRISIKEILTILLEIEKSHNKLDKILEFYEKAGLSPKNQGTSPKNKTSSPRNKDRFGNENKKYFFHFNYY